eukprot:gene6408-8819_t
MGKAVVKAYSTSTNTFSFVKQIVIVVLFFALIWILMRYNNTVFSVQDENTNNSLPTSFRKSSTIIKNSSSSINRDSNRLRLATWNIAAINNNPFEYWITNDDDPRYNDMMNNVSNFIESETDLKNNIQVKEIFTDDMFTELYNIMEKLEWIPKDNSGETIKNIWNNDYKNRKIMKEFIKDHQLGKKRLASMPDRVTNTINTLDGLTMRPTVINCYNNDLSTIQAWWKQWKSFFFEKEVIIKKNNIDTKLYIYQMLSRIKKSKYPSITSEEEELSIPLQTLCMAIFDSILIHMMNTIAPSSWQSIRTEMCLKLNSKKNDRTVDILYNSYSDSDIIFLQEVANNFQRFAENKPIAKIYDIHQSSFMDTDRDQNSFILLKKGQYGEISEVTEEVMNELKHARPGEKTPPVVNGDLIVLLAVDLRNRTKYLLASFHGDTNGLATIPIVSAIHSYALSKHPECKLLFGMDANTYRNPEQDQQGVTEFGNFFTEKKLNSCYGNHPNPNNFTTFHARTHLQTQLNKAVSLHEKDLKGDKNPKDFILFFGADFDVVSTTKDNTGKKQYIENMVFPTLNFPSDHGITSTILKSTMN